LDKRASAQGKRAISQWLNSSNYDRADVATATVAAQIVLVFGLLVGAGMAPWLGGLAPAATARGPAIFHRRSS
jgi:hypothetical protein